MTDKLIQYEKLEQEQQRIADQLERLKEDKEFQHDLEFKQQIELILEEYSKTGEDLLKLFGLSPNQPPKKITRRKDSPRLPLKRYTNPDTGKWVDARSIRNGTLQKWKDQYDEETVKSWAREIKDDGQSTPPS